jgi:hypothetical protein
MCRCHLIDQCVMHLLPMQCSCASSACPVARLVAVPILQSAPNICVIVLHGTHCKVDACPQQQNASSRPVGAYSSISTTTKHDQLG